MSKIKKNYIRNPEISRPPKILKSELTIREFLLVELVHFLAYGDEVETGLTLEETIRFLRTPIRSKDGLNSIECLEREGRRFIEELKIYLQDLRYQISE